MNNNRKYEYCDEDDSIRMFCAYCRRTLRNATTDYYREQQRYVKHEKLFSDMKEAELNALCSPCDCFLQETIFTVKGMDFSVKDSVLAEALSKLNTHRRTIILLYYFGGWTDKEIAQFLSQPRSTVQYQRNHALHLLKALLEKGEQQ